MKLTSGGNDSGALPIFEWHGDDVEKDEDCCWKAGRRNPGIETSEERVFFIALTQRRLAGVNMMCDVDEWCTYRNNCNCWLEKRINGESTFEPWSSAE